MAELVWDQVGERFYESGVSKGVFYDRTGKGTAWNGITSLEENTSTTVEPVYFDGLKFDDIVTNGDFSAVLKAFTYPNEFLPYEGMLQDRAGFYVTDQPRDKFCLSYRTEIADDVNGFQRGYKLHILYNLTANPSAVTYETLSLDTEPMQFEWTVTAIPEEIENFRPTAHLIFDSRRINNDLLRDVERIIYGNEEEDAYLPPLKSLATFVRKWDRLIITDHHDGTWTAESPIEGVITMLDSVTFEITYDTAIYLNATTYEISSSERNEEDIWPP
ncbi:MAG: hypothetical protein ABWY25_12275 [Paenisporosarcina sp.]